MPKPRRAGADGSTSSVRLVIKVTPDERRMLALAANHAGVSLTEYVRAAALARVRELLLSGATAG